MVTTETCVHTRYGEIMCASDARRNTETFALPFIEGCERLFKRCKAEVEIRSMSSNTALVPISDCTPDVIREVGEALMEAGYLYKASSDQKHLYIRW